MTCEIKKTISAQIFLTIPTFCIVQQRFFTDRYNLSFEQKRTLQ